MIAGRLELLLLLFIVVHGKATNSTRVPTRSGSEGSSPTILLYIKGAEKKEKKSA